jgi:PAS domain S-box-containing protein
MKSRPNLPNGVVLGFGVLLAVLAAGGVLGYVNVQRLAENERLVAQTHEVIAELEALLSTLKDAETGQRGYLLTEDEKYLQPYEEALNRVQTIVGHVKELTSDNPDQQARFAVIEKKIPARIDELRQTIDLTKRGDRPAAMKIVRTDAGKAKMDDLREGVAVMRRAEEDLLRQRDAQSQASFRVTAVSIVLSVVIGAVLVCLVFYLSQRNLRIRQRSAEVLAEQKERLRTTLASIGDAVISTDTEGRVTNTNAVAESLTGWNSQEAIGQPLDTVFRIVNEETLQPVHNPAKKAMKEGVIVGLANHTILIAKDGTERPIDDSAAPIRCANNEIVGCVLVFRDVTQRRKAERAASYLASIVESSDDVIIGKDINGIITSWNKSAERIFGYTAAEAIGRPIAMLAPPDRADEMPAILARIRQGEQIDHFDTLRRAKDGRLVPISLTVSPIKDKDGRIIGASKIARDISERKRAEEALREEKARLQATLTGIGDAVIVTDADSRVTMMNPVAQALTGWNEEAMGRPLDEVFRIINEQTRQPAENPVARVIREGNIVGLANHTVLIVKSGAELPIDDSAAPIRNSQGQITGCVLVFRNITQRLRAEQQQLDDSARLASIVNHVIDGIIAIDENGTVEAFNPAAQHLFGYRAEEVIGHNVKMLMPEPFHSEHDTYLANYRGTLKAKIIGIGREVEGRRKDGCTFPMDLAVSEFQLGKRRYFTGIVRDITDRKRAEKQTYDLLIELKEGDRRKDEFLAVLAHELRGPLAPLSNTLEIIKRSQGDGDLLQQALTTMERQLGHLVRLVDDLIDVSRITRDKIELRKERVELASIVHQSVETCRPLAESANHELAVILPPEAVHVHADPVRLAQVFSNILNNACKYTPPGGKISLTAERQGSDAVVIVKDTGLGIPPDKLRCVFEMFTQIDRTLERSQGGFGIGLTLVKRLVEMHGGSVEAHSEGLGKGSQFVVRLPILIEKPEVLPPEPAAEPIRRTARRILVVDDNADTASSLAMLLKLIGNETYTANDGLEAVEAAEKHRPDVVLLDIGLPKLNGYDACRRIREQPFGKNMLIVALTGWNQEQDRRRSKDEGFDSHLVKPVNLADLQKILTERQTNTV